MENRSLKSREFNTWDGERWSGDRISSKVFKQPILQLHLTIACVSRPKEQQIRGAAAAGFGRAGGKMKMF